MGTVRVQFTTNPYETTTIPTPQGFLDAIRAAPDDDTHRLVYADWLDDHGDSVRAEFIRLQCRLATLTQDYADWPALSAREQELLAQHGPTWAQPIASEAKPVFRRGFVDEVTLPVVGFPAHTPSLDDAPVRCLRLSGSDWESPPRWLAALGGVLQSPHLERIEELDLVATHLTPAGVRTLLGSPRWTGLRSLLLSDDDSTRAGLDELLRCPWLPNLHALSLWGFEVSDLGDAGANLLANAPQLAGLTTLDLLHNEIGPGGATALADSRHLAGLTSFSLGRSACGYTVNRIGPAGAAALARATFRERLEFLSLDLCGIGAPGLTALTRASFPRLRELHVRGNDLGDAGVRALVRADWLGSLRVLQLGRNGLSDDSLTALANADLANVRYLWLPENRFGPAGAEALARLAQLPDLRELNLAFNPLGERAVRALLGASWPACFRRLYLRGVTMGAELQQSLRELLGERVRF